MPSILVNSRERGRGGDREGRDRERQGNTGREMGRLRQGERDIGMQWEGEGAGETEKWRETEGIHVLYSHILWEVPRNPAFLEYHKRSFSL